LSKNAIFKMNYFSSDLIIFSKIALTRLIKCETGFSELDNAENDLFSLPSPL
jgi:hypothetical protein